MKVRIHHGAHEIGGNCVEVEHEGLRLVLDVGRPLTAGRGDPIPLPDIAGLSDSADESVLGVLISHHHQDHWGLVDQIRVGMSLFMGAATERILRAAAFWTRGLEVPVAGHLVHRTPFELGPFTVTPYLNDHSAFDAYSLLVEAGDERLFYTGDIRGHGRKHGVFQQLLDDPPSDVDVLLMEGTNLQPGMPPKPVMSESEVENAMVETFSETDGMALVISSAQNIDRLVTIYRAVKRTGRQLVMDPYTADIARATGYDTIPRPHPDWPLIHTYMPTWQSRRVKDAQAFERLGGADGINPYRLYPEDLAASPSDYVLLFSVSDGPKLAAAGALDGATCTYSLWSGYLDQPSGQRVRAFLEQHRIPLVHHHTSGHASVQDLQRLANAIDARQVVPIHTFGADAYSDIVGNAVTQPDGVWWETRTLAPTPAVPFIPTEEHEEGDGYDVHVYVPYSTGDGDRPPEVIGAVMRPDGGTPAWVPGWRDDTDPKDSAGAWGYYEEGWGVSQARGYFDVRVRDVGDAVRVVAELQGQLVERFFEQQAAADAGPSVEGVLPTNATHMDPDVGSPSEIPRLDPLAYLTLLGSGVEGLAHAAADSPAWAVGVIQLHRILHAPTAGHWFPRAPQPGDPPEAGAAYYTPLVHMLLYRLGWVRPERGLDQWQLGRGDPADRHLALLGDVWDREIDLGIFHAWLYTVRDHGPLAHVAHAAGFEVDHEPAPRTPGWVDDAIARATQLAPELPLPIGGGGDNLHLLHHVLGAVGEPTQRAQFFVESWEARSGALVLETMSGWWRLLHTHPRLYAIEQESGSSWDVEVLVRSVGSLGVYRRSPNTGIRHATNEQVHAMGVWPV